VPQISAGPVTFARQRRRVGYRYWRLPPCRCRPAL